MVLYKSKGEIEMDKMLKALDKKGIKYNDLTSVVLVDLIHPTIEYEVNFVISENNGIYCLTAECGEWDFEPVERKTPKAIIDNMELIMKNLPRTLDGWRMSQWESFMEM